MVAPPLAWLDPLPDAARMRATDAWAIERLGIEGFALMRTAGAALADAVVDVAPEGPVAIVCGAGNNGGDGYVAAAVLREAGREVRTLSTVPDERLAGDAARARDLHGAPAEPWRPAALDGAAVIVDAVLGTGATGAPRGVAGEAIAAIARAAGAGVPVVACDVPSGVDATTGEVAGPAVPATVTVTFHRATSGLWIAPGKQRVGRLLVADIGIPAAVDRALDREPPGGGDGEAAPSPGPGAGDGSPEPSAALLGSGIVRGLAHRGPSGTKFRSGHVLVVGGAPGMTGAPCLSARGAMRAGAGYATLAVAGGLEPTVAARAPVETLTLALPDGPDGAIAAAAVDVVAERLRGRAGTLVLGPGLGRGGEQPQLVRGLLAAIGETPLVLDADGLAAIAGDLEAVREHRGPTVLTPHAGELARLLDVPVDDVADRRLAHAREAARRSGAVVVLKGDDTLVVDPDGRLLISPGDAPGLATAGTGDVLAGVVGALLARGAEPLTAAGAAVWLHLQAGRRAARDHGVDGTVAGDVAEAVALVRRDADARSNGDPADRSPGAAGG